VLTTAPHKRKCFNTVSPQRPFTLRRTALATNDAFDVGVLREKCSHVTTSYKGFHFYLIRMQRLHSFSTRNHNSSSSQSSFRFLNKNRQQILHAPRFLPLEPLYSSAEDLKLRRPCRNTPPTGPLWQLLLHVSRLVHWGARVLEGGLMRTSGTVEFTFHAAARVILARDGLEWSSCALSDDGACK
jgi:hypothetical protein